MTARSRQVVWFLLPWATGYVVLTAAPMAASLALSCSTWDQLSSRSDDRPLSPSHKFSWVGTDHYRKALAIDRSYPPGRNDPWYWYVLGGKPTEPRFYTSLYNSLFYSVFAVPLGLCMSLIVAMLLNRSFRGISVVRACIYLPHVLGGVATIVIWSWLFNPQFGWINEVIRSAYALLDPIVRLFRQDGTTDWPVPRWLYSPSGCKPAVIIMSAWMMGGSMLIFLAALRRISPQLYEAAQLDGAGAWRRLRYVTFPQITPALLFNLTFSSIFAMQSFNEAYLLQNRGQDDGLLFYMLYLYEAAFEPPYQLGYASALAWILFLVLFVLVGTLLWTSRRWVHYAVGE